MRSASTLPLLSAVALCATVAACVVGPLEGAIVGCTSLALVCVATLGLRRSEPQGPAPAPTSRDDSRASERTPADEKPAPQPTTPAKPQAAAPKPASVPVAVEPQAAQDDSSEAPLAQPEPRPSQRSTHEQAADAPAPPAIAQTAGEGDQEAPTFSYEAFRRDVLLAEDPMGTLRSLVQNMRERAEASEEALTGAERFLVRQLTDAGLFSQEDDERLPPLRIVWPHHSQTFYLRLAPSDVTYGAHLRVLRIEASLNALNFAHGHFDDLATVPEEELWRFWQRMTATVCAQGQNVQTANWSYLAMPWQTPFGPSGQGEWAVRHGLSEAVESVQVPYRLEAHFRANVASGDVALEIKATPARVFPKSAYVSGLGIVPTTAHMRRREASNYAIRVGLLMASHAFNASDRVRRVWVAAVQETPTRRECWYSVCIDRRAFSHVRLDALASPVATLRSLGGRLDEHNGVLLPVQQTFYLEEERFCPRKRHDIWELSERTLPASAALSLGTSRVSGLAIHEELPRTLAAESLLRHLNSPASDEATLATVRAVLNIAHDTSDISVWGAAERVANKLVDGTLDLADPEALRDELVEGDTLSRAVERAQRQLQRQDAQGALLTLRGVLEPIDSEGRYTDTSVVAYRCFDTFAERVLYNRTHAGDRRATVLVPDAYLIAHLLMSAILTATAGGEGDHMREALAHASRALDVAPYNASANLGMAACLERSGDLEGAAEQIRKYLRLAYSPQGIGLAYYRMAGIQWRMGHVETCQACYQRSARILPQLVPVVLMECQLLIAQGAEFEEVMDEQEVTRWLSANEIPASPSAETSYMLYDSATASIDAEVFPVARDLMRTLESLTGDDVMHGITSSLELEPDE